MEWPEPDFPELVDDLIRDGLVLAGRVARTDDEVVCKLRDRSQSEDENILGLFLFCGEDRKPYLAQDLLVDR